MIADMLDKFENGVESESLRSKISRSALKALPVEVNFEINDAVVFIDLNTYANNIDSLIDKLEGALFVLRPGFTTSLMLTALRLSDFGIELDSKFLLPAF